MTKTRADFWFRGEVVDSMSKRKMKNVSNRMWAFDAIPLAHLWSRKLPFDIIVIGFNRVTNQVHHPVLSDLDSRTRGNPSAPINVFGTS